MPFCLLYTQDPKKHLRDALAYARRQSVFDLRGYFDYYNLYLLLATDDALLSTAIKKGIFDNNRNFDINKLYNYVIENTELLQAAKTLGVLSSDKSYSRVAVFAITSNYTAVKEKSLESFSVYNPATVQTSAQLQLVLSLAFAAKIIDENATVDVTKLYDYMNKFPNVGKNMENYLIAEDENLKFSGLRNLLTEYPYLRNVLVDCGIIDDLGQYVEKALRVLNSFFFNN
jgi:hypothetical protein